MRIVSGVGVRRAVSIVHTNLKNEMPPTRGCLVYRHVLFDESILSYVMDLQDAIEEMRVKRDKKVEDGETAQAMLYEDMRNKFITDLVKLLQTLKK